MTQKSHDALEDRVRSNLNHLLALFDGDRRRTPESIARQAWPLVGGISWASKVPGAEVAPGNRHALAVLLARVIVTMDTYEMMQQLSLEDGSTRAPDMPLHERLPSRRPLHDFSETHLGGWVRIMFSYLPPPITRAEFEEAVRSKTGGERHDD